MPRSQVLGCFLMVMQWADRHTEDGRVNGVDLTDLDAVAECDGFGEAMRAAGWLEIDSGGVVFLEWEKHNGRSAKKRAMDARRASAKRRIESDDRPQNVAFEATKKRPRVEKSRVEESREDLTPIQGVDFAHPEDADARDKAAVAAGVGFRKHLGMSGGSVQNACRSIGQHAALHPCHGHTPEAVVEAAFARVASYPKTPKGVGHWKNSVRREITNAHENGELPGPWRESEPFGKADTREAVGGW